MTNPAAFFNEPDVGLGEQPPYIESDPSIDNDNPFLMDEETFFDQANKLDQAAAVAKDPGKAPTMPSSEDPTVELRYGIQEFPTSSTSVTQFRIRELTGRDEEIIERLKPHEQLSAIVALGVQSVGGRDLSGLPLSERTTLLGSLLSAEELRLFVEIIAHSFGNEKELTFTCNNPVGGDTCGAVNEVRLLLREDFEIEYPDDVVHNRVRQISLPKSGKEITYHMVTASDLATARSQIGSNPTASRTTTFLLGQVVMMIDGNVPMSAEDEVRDLPSLDRRVIADDLQKNQPDLQLDVKTRCVECMEEVILPLQWGDLFRL